MTDGEAMEQIRAEFDELARQMVQKFGSILIAIQDKVRKETEAMGGKPEEVTEVGFESTLESADGRKWAVVLRLDPDDSPDGEYMTLVSLGGETKH